MAVSEQVEPAGAGDAVDLADVAAGRVRVEPPSLGRCAGCDKLLGRDWTCPSCGVDNSPPDPDAPPADPRASVPEAPPFDPFSDRCETCVGWGIVQTGSVVAGQETRQCPSCYGAGWKDKLAKAPPPPIDPPPATPPDAGYAEPRPWPPPASSY